MTKNSLNNRLKSPFMIVPKDKRVLKSSKVRAYYKTLNDILEPNRPPRPRQMVQEQL